MLEAICRPDFTTCPALSLFLRIRRHLVVRAAAFQDPGRRDQETTTRRIFESKKSLLKRDKRVLAFLLTTVIDCDGSLNDFSNSCPKLMFITFLSLRLDFELN